MVPRTLAADSMTAVSGLTEWRGLDHGVLGQTTVEEAIFGAADPGWGVAIQLMVILSVLFAGLALVAMTAGRTPIDLMGLFR
jgi:hypothetical protein